MLDEFVYQRFAAFLRERNLANMAHIAHKASLFMYSPLGYHTTLPLFLTIYACRDYWNRLCRPYDGCLPGVSSAIRFLPGYGRIENRGSQGGNIPIYEPNLAELLEEARPILTFTKQLCGGDSGAEVVFIAVGTPPTPSGAPNLEFLSQAARCIGQHCDGHFTVVVNKSTVPIGSGNWVGSLLREAVRAAAGRMPADFAVASNPEFLREGSALHDSLYPDRIVIGADEPRALEVLYSLYRPILDQTFTAPTYLPRPEDGGRRSAGFYRPGFGRADQVRRQRIPGAQDQLHQ